MTTNDELHSFNDRATSKTEDSIFLFLLIIIIKVGKMEPFMNKIVFDYFVGHGI